jgi:SAM-dependent methyltransferase
MRPDRKYESGDYLQSNPTWDIEDSPWKAGKVAELIRHSGIEPRSICEVGCGAGAVLAALRETVPDARLAGFDIADASSFWKRYEKAGINFRQGDFLAENSEKYDLILVLDVIEHIANPWDFLERLKPHGDKFLFHIPLDLSAQNVLREVPLLEARRKVGHIHYFTKNLALELLGECGYHFESISYSGLSMSGPRSSWKSRLVYLPRAFMYALNKDFGVRLLGGERLLVLASVRSD